jgi:hypothetical protein
LPPTDDDEALPPPPLPLVSSPEEGQSPADILPVRMAVLRLSRSSLLAGSATRWSYDNKRAEVKATLLIVDDLRSEDGRDISTRLLVLREVALVVG